jgi:predicted Zn-dependent protease
MRNAGVLIDDPLLEEYLGTLAVKLTEVSEKPEQRYAFVMLRDRSLNAFATPGGLIAVHTGLITAAEDESELAAVLAHEIAHVSQKHIVRAIERSQKAQWPVLLASLAAMALAKDGDAKVGALTTGFAAMQQLQINYTRSNEFEADRIGIRTLQRADFDVHAMARMFGRMQRATVIAPEERVPEFLRTHPVTTTRISEAKARAVELASKQVRPTVSSDSYRWMRARVRVIEMEDPRSAIRLMRQAKRNQANASELSYGIVVAALLARDAPLARSTLKELRPNAQTRMAYQIAQAELLRLEDGDWMGSYEALASAYPNHRVVARSFASALLEKATPSAGKRVVELMKPLIGLQSSDPALYELLARGHQLSGDDIRAGEAYARAHALRGAFEDALLQLQSLARKPELDYYERARLDAQIAELTPVVIAVRERYGRRTDWQGNAANTGFSP